MKFTANRAELLAQVKMVLKVVPSHSTVEVLKGILVEADAESYEISLSSTNYEVAVQCKIPAAVEAGGSMVIDAKLFSQMLALLGETDVTLELQSNMTCTVKSGKAVYNLSVQPSKNYPRPDIPFPENAVKVGQIAGAAKTTVYAAAKTQDKPVMSGVRLDIGGNRLRACGCDGMRLMEHYQKTESAGNLRFLIPANSFRLLSGMVKDEDVLDVGLAGGCAVFTKPKFLFSAKTISGEYIDVDGILTSLKPEYSAMVETNALASALDMLSTVAGNGGSVHMAFIDGKIQLSCEGDIGQSRTYVDAEVKKATPPDGFRYSPGYLYEAMRRLNGQVEIQLSSIGMLQIKTESETYFQIPMLSIPKNKKKKSA